MIAVNASIAKTIKWFLIVFGVATSMTLPYAIDINLLTPMLVVLSIIRRPACQLCGTGES